MLRDRINEHGSEAIAKRLGWPVRLVNAICNGARVHPDQAEKMARVLGIPVEHWATEARFNG